MIRLGFIGVGGYGRYHVEGFLPYQKLGRVQITALADSSFSVLHALGNEPGLEGAKQFGDYRDLLGYEELDAVVICAPIPLHREMALAALKRNIPILLEKPPVPLLSQLDELIEADLNRRVMVAFQHIYSEVIWTLKQGILEGQLGRLRSISTYGLWPRPTGYYRRANWAGQMIWHGLPVLDGPCTNALSHFLNLLLFLAGPEERDFACPQEVGGELYRARPDLPGYDTGCLHGTLQGGVDFFAGFSHACAENIPVKMGIRGDLGNWSLQQNGCMLFRPGLPALGGNEGNDQMRLSFLDFVEGDVVRNMTPLDSMRAYVLATNLMCVSSGGIRSISSEFVQKLKLAPEQELFAVDNLEESLKRSAENLTPLYEADVPWAMKSSPLGPRDFSEEQLACFWELSSQVVG